MKANKMTLEEKLRDSLTRCAVNGMHLQRVNKKQILAELNQITQLITEAIPEERKRSEVSKWYEKRIFGKRAVEEINALEEGYDQAISDIKKNLGL